MVVSVAVAAGASAHDRRAAATARKRLFILKLQALVNRHPHIWARRGRGACDGSHDCCVSRDCCALRGAALTPTDRAVQGILTADKRCTLSAPAPPIPTRRQPEAGIGVDLPVRQARHT